MAQIEASAPAAAEHETHPKTSALSILDMPDDAAANSRRDASPEDPELESAATDPTSDDDGPAAPELDEIEAAGDEQDPSPESDEPKAPRKPEKTDRSDDDAVHYLRDRTAVSMKDLKSGYERAREIETRVFPTVRQEYQSFQQARQAFEAQQQQLQPVLANVATILQDRIPEEPDIALLDPANPGYDPMEYSRQESLRNRAIRQVQTVEAARRAQEAENARRMQHQQAAYLQEQRQALAQRLPHLRDEAKAKEFSAGWHAVGRYAGFNQQELAQVFDHRLLVVGDLAMDGLRYRQERQTATQRETEKARNAAAKVENKPPMPKPAVQPPAARTPAVRRETLGARASLERLRKTGSVRDAEDFLARYE